MVRMTLSQPYLRWGCRARAFLLTKLEQKLRQTQHGELSHSPVFSSRFCPDSILQTHLTSAAGAT